ncbi:MAG TPA: TonB-dependent receptor [Pedobacter sp.]|jgi:Fe(3+) dicitrate transport protein
MTLKDFKCLFIFLFSVSLLQASAQSQLQGKVSDISGALGGVKVTMKDGNRSTLTDSTGAFSIELGSGNSAVLNFTKFGYRDSSILISASKFFELEMRSLSQVLNIVTVSDNTKKRNFGYLRSVEGTAIYAGKKTEVIRMDNVIANLSTNNAREIYAKVAGLNIWESEGGLQLNIGGRGLNPNRAANFNVRQNGHDISPDALGYPESYYTPPAEAVESIEIVRGAASLQYGTQFGGMINFVMRKPDTAKLISFVSRQSVASYGLFNTFNSISGKHGKFGYYAYVNYKQANGWRPNSEYNNVSVYTHIDYAINPKSSLTLEHTYLNYLSQQAGGLSDRMFREDPRQSNRERNWFGINWNLFHLAYDRKVGNTGKVNIKTFGLLASRKALGFLNYSVEAPDGTATAKENRELITGNFNNIGIEARYLQTFRLFGLRNVGLIGTRNYQVSNRGKQGLGNNGSGSDFNYIESPENFKSDYKYPNFNQSFFLENIIYLKDNLTLTPGIRYEFINTRANGSFREVQKDLARNIIQNKVTNSSLGRKRSFIIAGLGLERKSISGTSIYTNISQNFRAITFSDIHITSPSFLIDTNIVDERGFSLDAGIRNQTNRRFRYDVSLFALHYGNRIGEYQVKLSDSRLVTQRTNIGEALISGLESFLSYDVIKTDDLETNIFSNLTLVQSRYTKSERPEVEGNKVEFVPEINFKGGIESRWKSWRSRLQITYLSKQFTDATNDLGGRQSAVTGVVPAFHVLDFGLSKQWKHIKLETGINNFTNQYYFTRRATGYPGPGIIPSTNRSFYLGLQFTY